MSDERFEYVIAGPSGYSADPCVPSENYDSGITSSGVEFVRTPDAAFANLTGYSWSPNYVDVDGGLRMHYIDAAPEPAATAKSLGADPELVLLLHGQPTWSYLYRKMIPILISRGYRVIAPDWIGFGRSDKPTDLAQHTYLKQVGRLKSFISQVIPEALDSPKINLFVQDWGSLIGLRTVGDEPEWFRRIIVANGILPVLPPNINIFGDNPNPVNYNCSDNRTVLDMALERQSSRPCGLDTSCFQIWLYFALTNPTWMPSVLLQLTTAAAGNALDEATLAAYDVPFPTRTYMAAPRAFPSMVRAVYEPEFGNAVAWQALQNFSRPFLALAGEKDPNLGSVEVQSNFVDNVLGASIHDFEHKRYPNAGHFIQEDAGEEVAFYIADFIQGTAHLVGEGGPPTTSGCNNQLVGHNILSLLLPVVCVLLHILRH